MPQVRDPLQIMGMLDGGQFAEDLKAEFADVIDTLAELSGPKRPKKGSVTLTINFEVEEDRCTVSGAIKSKTPEAPRGGSFYFVTDGGLSTEHPRQPDMFRPRDTDEPRERVAGATGVDIRDAAERA